jgi:hypothetical protein
VASDGTPVKSALLFTPKFIPEGIEFKGRPLLVRDGLFELPGCDPNGKVPVWVYNRQSVEGGLAEFAASAGGEPVVRLAPLVYARLLVADEAGKLVPGVTYRVQLVLRPGDDAVRSAEKGTLAGIAVPGTAFYSRDVPPSGAGAKKASRGDMIPGATYTVEAITSSARSQIITFTAPTTGFRDLGTITLEPPPAGKKATAPATVGQVYVYKPVVVDSDGDPVTFDLVRGPAGMSADPLTGVVYWVPGPTQVGTHTVMLRVADPYGGSSTQPWQITVSAQPDPPPTK